MPLLVIRKIIKNRLTVVAIESFDKEITRSDVMRTIRNRGLTVVDVANREGRKIFASCMPVTEDLIVSQKRW